MKKRLLSILLAAVMCVGLVPVGAMAETTGSFTTSGGLTVTGGTTDTDYSYEGNVLTIKTSRPLTISGTTTTDRIVVNGGVTANITLSNVSITHDGGNSNVGKPISGGTIKITLEGTNNLTSTSSGSNAYGIDAYTVEIGGNGDLNISCQGSIYAEGIEVTGTLTFDGSGTINIYAAATNGAYGIDCGTASNITIRSGTLILNAKKTGSGYERALYMAPQTLPGTYWWRTSKTAEYTQKTANGGAYTYSDAHSYLEITTREPHTHNWTYAANGATITATCGNSTCGYSETLTISASNSTYVGAEIGASLSRSTNCLSELKSVYATHIQYQKKAETGETYSEITGNPKDAGTYKASVTAGDKTISVTYTIAKATITVTPNSGQSKFFGASDPSLTYGFAGNVAGQTPGFTGALNRAAGENVGAYAIGVGTLALADSGNFKADNYTLAFSDQSVNFTINKAAWGQMTATGSAKYGNTGEVDLSSLIAPGGALGDVSASGDVLEGAPTVNDKKLSFAFKSNARAGSTATITIPVTSATDYNDYSIIVTVTVLDKAAQNNFAFGAATQTKTYGDADFTVAATGAADGSTVTYASSNTAAATVDNTGKVHIVGAGETTITATAAATDEYAEATATYTLTVNKATITITAKDKSAYVNDTAPELGTPVLGTDYTVTGLAAGETLGGTLILTCNPTMGTVGEYVITPSGAAAPEGGNYNDIVYVNGTLTISNRPTTGGGGGGGSTTTTTERNPDGSTTTTTNNKVTGVVTENTRYPDGSSVVTITQKDGTGTTEVKLSDRAVENADKEGKPVTLPLEPVVAGETGPVQVTLPGPHREVLVAIPVENVTPGMVAVLVKENGTKEVIRQSLMGEDAIEVVLRGAAVVEVADNSKDFSDLNGHWAKREVNYVTARELYVGVGNNLFVPDGSMTRGMLTQVLHNLENNPAHAFHGSFPDLNDHWAQDSVYWAAENGIVGGYPDGSFGVEDNISREQLAVMLWRYSGQPKSGHDLTHFSDHGMVSSYALQALAWCNETGIVTGRDTGVLDPLGKATRAEVAAMLMRMMEH